MLLMRIFTVDFYMSPPIQGLDVTYSEFRGSCTHSVPVIRIFGSSDKGYKTCLHIHGAFPYIYIPFEGSDSPASEMYQIVGKLDQAINTVLGQANSTTQHVYKISLVSGIPLYGYHTREHQFLKIYFYNPLILRKACNLLQNGNVLGKPYQLHEGHVPFILQFMIDFNLHGMNFISLSEVRYRINPDVSQEDIPPELLLPNSIFKTSICHTEVDGLAEHIVNRLEVATGRITKNPGISALWEDEKQRRRNNGQDSQISPCMSQTRINVEPTASHKLFKDVLKEKLRAQDDQTHKEDPNASVYPAETIKSKNIQNASFVESHYTSTDTSSSSYSTSVEYADLNLSNQSLLFDTSLNDNHLDNSDARNLLQILEVLGENAEIEEDSMLSQTLKHLEESEEENEVDMSLPLAAVTTPTKIITNESDQNNETSELLNENHHEDMDVTLTCESDRARIVISESSKNNEVDDSKTATETISEMDDQVPHERKSQENSEVTGFHNIVTQPSSFSCTNEEESAHIVLLEKAKTKEFLKDVDKQKNDSDHRVSETAVDRAKRNLNFAEEFPGGFPDITLVEEKRVCSYTPSNFGKALVHKTEDEAKRKCSLKGDFNKRLDVYPVYSSSSEELFSLSSRSGSLKKEDVFETKLDKNDNQSCNNTLAIAEKYDRDKNYICIAGPSNFCDKDCDIFGIRHLPSSSSDSSVSYQKCSGQTMYNTPYQSGCSNFSTCEDLMENSQTALDKPNLLCKIKLTQNLSMLETSAVNQNIAPTSCGCYAWMPKFNPPSREMISKTMDEYEIPTLRYQRPFYSNYGDVTGEVQVGYSVLKIASRTSDLPEFESSTANLGIQQLRKAQVQEMYPNIEITQNKLKSIKLSFYEVGDCVLTPSKDPPFRKEVELWLSTKRAEVKSNELPKQQKIKMPIPCSPGAESDSDESVISLSPFSPVSVQSFNEEESYQQTPKSSSKATSTESKTSQKSKRKLLRSNNHLKRILNSSNEQLGKKKTNESDHTLRKTLLQSQFLNNLLSPSETSRDSGQITAATLDNTYGFKMSLENLQKAKAVSEYQYLTVLVMEVHVKTRLDYKPNPELDPIRAIFYSLLQDAPESVTDSRRHSGVFVVNSANDANKIPAPSDQKSYLLDGSGVTCPVTYVDSEIHLINEFVKFVKSKDPDICAGYEVELLSWGYLIDRGYTLGINLQLLLARTQIKRSLSDDEQSSGLKLAGRVILDVWRLMRHEIALQSYTFENIVYHILHKRVPLYSFRDLSFWWEHSNAVYWHKTVNFYLCRVEGILELLDRLDLIGRTSELARLFGIQFYEVLSRGSQFRVESMMLRLAKPLNYVAVSPSVQQRAKMKAPEFLPLILEPQSKFFVDPVIVLDFQSLYPSMIIAYNYCFSTCLGRVEHLGKNSPFSFGATQLKVSKRILKRLSHKDLINYSPCGVAFVKPKVREGILPRMLSEILDTRLMVKKSMKQNKDDKVLQRVLHSRQLGLKLIANVTYGYTAANFSGRMPAVELGDSVVSKGRETLLRAIKLIENTPRWGAKVVYGDTDSIFVLVPGKSRQCAFQIGTEIADAVTWDNPSPVKLKLEKVFHPCILQTKKRYVGYMYESEDQSEPEFCAKGIETVRRDGCPAVSKMLEKTLKILFDTRDVSLVQKYVVRQFTKLLSGQISLQDLIFAKEYRGASNYRPGACVPVLELTRKWLTADKRSEPRIGERVPYVIVNGPPGLPLIKLVRSPRELLSDSNLIPNMLYYITRVIIPPLNRCFTLIGADLNNWFNNMPRKQIHVFTGTPDSTGRKRAISHYFSTTSCVACNRQTQQGLCIECCNAPQQTLVLLQNKIRCLERAHGEINLICQSCTGHPQSTQCISLDCPVMYRMVKSNQNLQQVPYLQQIVSATFDEEL